MKTVKYKICAGKEILSCEVDYFDETTSPSVICLHGGGPSSKKSTEYLLPVFHSHRKSVIRFDFSGQGDSTGKIEESSLKKRNAEAKAILDFFNLKDKLTVIGSSMGGYVASTLVRDYHIENLILFCPAAYSTKAWDIGFSEGFTEIIRKTNSFMNTDIIEILSNYYGKSLFFIGSEDDIIPEEVTDMYSSGLSNSSLFDKNIIENCPHPIHRWSQKNPEVHDFIKARINKFLS